MAETIGGTVIQRSFVGRGVPNVIHIATVPLDEIGSSNTDLQNLLSEILGVPSESVLSISDYSQVLRGLEMIPSDSVYREETGPFWRYQMSRILEASTREMDNQRFLGDFVSLVTSSASASALTAFYRDWLPTLTVSDDALDVALSCISSVLNRRRTVDAFYEEMLSYDIPLGQSPQTRGDSLLTLLQTARNFCIAPLAAGGTQAITQLSQGNYVGALLTTGTASVMTLVLIGTVSVGSLIVQRVAQTRTRVAPRISRVAEPA